MEEKNSLLRCPFCGGEANVKMWCEPDTPFLVMCESCKASVMDYPTEAEAIEAWNRRVETTVETLMRVFAYDATCGVCDKRKERTVKVQILPRRSETSMSWEGKCSNCGADMRGER